MLLRKRILKRFRNLDLMRRIHIAVAALGGLFLVLHVAYFLTWPLNTEIFLGYVSATLALVVWVTGTAFLERFRDSLYFHGTLSLSAISLMVIHSSAAGLNVPFAFAEVVLGGTVVVAIYKTTLYVDKLKTTGGFKK
jgi:multidrug transporter EmrE-like cation transporter